MLRHCGRKRTFQHNLRLAILLSTTAGIINVAGFIAFSIFTTNVTGHVAQAAKEISDSNWYFAKIIALWMFLFMLGAFFSSILINFWGKLNPRFSHSIPLFIEAFILFYVGYIGQHIEQSNDRDHFLAGSLLFAMGMQNAMVSVVSGFVVRTTHLTGLFTDLGIEFARLFSIKKEEKAELNKKIILHSSIVIMFIVGGVIGGISFHHLKYKTFILACTLLIIALFYDSMRIGIYKLQRKIRTHYHYK